MKYLRLFVVAGLLSAYACPAWAKPPIYWWVGNRTDMPYMSGAEHVDGFTVAYLGAHNPAMESHRGYRAAGDYGDMDSNPSTNNVVTTITALQEQYAQGARRLSTDLEWGYFSPSETRQFVDAVNAMPGLKVLQWNGYWNWGQSSRDLLEQCPGIILAEMIYPLVDGPNQSYETVYARISNAMSYYTYQNEQTHAIGMSICYFDDSGQTHLLPWDKMKMQIDAAKAYGRSIGHPNQAIAFYEVCSDGYFNQIVEYAAVPEPTSLCLFLAGALFLCSIQRSRAILCRCFRSFLRQERVNVQR